MSNFTLVKKAKSMLQNIWDGMKSIWLMKRKGLFVIQTLLIWTGYFLYFYITFYAFDFTRDLGVTVGLIAFTMSSIAVAVPVHGGDWSVAFMVIATLMCFGVKETDAAAFCSGGAYGANCLARNYGTVWCGGATFCKQRN